MNRLLSYLNIFGVGVLGFLCVLQWQTNRQANLDRVALEKQNRDLAAETAEQSKSIQGLNDDLSVFREQLSKASALARQTDSSLRSLQRENAHLAAERDQLRTNLASWTEAVAARDQRLTEANQAIQSLLTNRDAVVAQYNALAEKHNALVKNFDELQRLLASARTNVTRAKEAK